MRDAVSEWQALSDLYEQAELLTAPALDAWLARLAEEGHPLLAPLAQMLGARAKVRSNGFLSDLPALPLRLPSSDLEAGARIGPYRLLRAIGSGGMAEVWQAERDDGAFRRTVAIKLLFRHVAGAQGESFAQRFTRERDILASLDHPNIARLHDAGVTPAGQPWLALEYVEGETLTAWCDRASLGVRARVELFRQVLLAVQHAHANLVIHRDLKPANILVTQAGEVRLLDFGIAKLMEAEGGVLADTELTRHAGRPMTVAYASPEQLTGRPLTTATDVYSLGVVFYELLCGERPAEPRRDSPALLEQAILEIDPRAPSRRALTHAVAAGRGTTPVALRKALGNDLDAITLRALAKQPAQRYPSVDALRVELDRWLAGEPVEARAPSQAYRIAKFAQRHRLGVVLGSGAVAALLVVAAVAVWLGLQARQESARALAARDFMMGMFKQADTDKSHGADVTARELLDRGRDDVLRRLAGQPALQADLLEGIAGIQSSMDELTKADVTFDELAKLYRRMGAPQRAGAALAARADIALRMGRLDLAHSLAEAAKTETEGLRPDPRLSVSLGLTAAWLALWEDRSTTAGRLFEQNLKVAEKEFGPESSQALSALIGLMQSDANSSNFEAAIIAEQEFERRQLKAPGRNRRDMVELDVNYVELHLLAGKYREVMARKLSAVPGCVAAFGANDVDCRRLALVSAAAAMRLGDLSTMRSDLPTLQSMANDGASPDTQRNAWITLARSLLQLGEFENHQDVVDRLKWMAQDKPGTLVAPVRRMVAMQLLVEGALRNGRLGEARQRLQESLDFREGFGERIPGYVPSAINELLNGVVSFAENHPADALAKMEKSEELEGAAIGRSHPQVILHSLNRVRVLVSLGRNNDALRLVDRAEPVLRDALGLTSVTYRRLAALRELTKTRTRANASPERRGAAKHSVLESRENLDFFN